MHHTKATTTYVRMHAYIHTLEYTRCTQELSAASKKQDKQSSALEKLEGELQQVRKELEEKRLKGREWADQVCTYAFNICMRVCVHACICELGELSTHAQKKIRGHFLICLFICTHIHAYIHVLYLRTHICTGHRATEDYHGAAIEDS